MDIDTVSGVSEAPFPDVTVCDSNQFSRRVARDWGVLNDKGVAIKWSSFPWTNRSVAQFFKEAAPTLPQLVTHCNGNDCICKEPHGGNTSLGVWTAGWYRRGLCYTFHPHGVIVRNRQRFLQLDTCSDPDDSTLQLHEDKAAVSTVQIFFHGPETPIVDNDFDDTEPTAHLTIQTGEVLQLAVSGRQRRLRPLRRRPCNVTAGYSRPRCLVLCRWAEWARQTGCRPPWSDAAYLPLCNTMYEFLKMKDKRLILTEEDPCPSRCLPACATTIYQLQITKLITKTALKERHQSSLKVIWPYVADRTSERLSYSGSDLISDVGGSLGLLLGLSVLSAVQLAEDAVKALLDRCRRVRRGIAASIIVSTRGWAGHGNDVERGEIEKGF